MEISSKTPIKAKEVLDALNEKAQKKHTHIKEEIDGFSDHTHTKEEIDGFYDHTHTKEEIDAFYDHTHNNRYYTKDEIDDLSSLMPNSDTLDIIKTKFYVPDDCSAGTTVILDGIECLCVATDVTIQGSDLRRIAVDKNHDLGYYQKYVGVTQNGIVTNKIKPWRWGGHGTILGNTSTEVGYGLQNTINCLANTVNYTKGTYTGTGAADGYPWLWQGVNDFRSAHSDKWFVPSQDELKNYVYPYKNMLTSDTATGGSLEKTSIYWTSSENPDSKYPGEYVCGIKLETGSWYGTSKYYYNSVRLCRAF